MAGIAAVIGMLAVGTPLRLVGLARQAGTAQSMLTPVLHIYSAALMVIGLLLSVPSVMVGLGLRNFKPQSRDYAMVICALLLAVLPVGTLLAVYGFWVMLSPEVEPLFSPRR